MTQKCLIKKVLCCDWMEQPLREGFYNYISVILFSQHFPPLCQGVTTSTMSCFIGPEEMSLLVA